ncbi:hypothetical protein [Hymenobacter ruricola]|uniref:Glycosyltransferase RgtA/B/C/D-like domain-containing protein n=1 Tax=Hymenobacter ruricola TaxID=2791023 RepID=A0ABS0I189_9BACT|nr:hypothetical protein [Hymenobacter ruricola]MBF9220349.1 hypothetical protein [Hymenobacter ruricola]
MSGSVPEAQVPSAGREALSQPGGRFFLLVGLGLLALCAGYAAAILHSTPWAEARGLDAIFPFYAWRTRPFTAGALARAWQLLGGAAAALGLLAAGLAAGAPGRQELRALARQGRAMRHSLAQTAASLTPRQRRLAWWGFAALTVLRAGLSLASVTPEYDDAASYTLFVSQGLFVTASYYPIPNNHVLSNVLSWLFYQVSPNFWWTMRLPVLLTTSAATVLWFVGFLRWRVKFWPAALALLLFSISKLSIYHSSVGRGYWLLTALAGVMFFVTLALGENTRHPRAAWALFILSGVLGAYTVPTFAVVIASAGAWLAWQFIRQKAYANLLRLLTAGLLTVAATLLLYSPLLFVSGPAIFFGNGFVAPRPLPEFVAGLPAYLWENEGFLAGQIKAGAVLTILGLALAAVLWRRARRGQLPAAQAAPWLGLAPAALWFWAFPYAVLMAQRVFAPGRTLLYKAIFFFVLLAMGVEWLLERPKFRQWRALRPGLAVAALVWTGYQFESLWRDNRIPHQHNADYHAAFAWLARQPRGPVLVPEPTHSIFLRLYFRSELPAQSWQLDGRPAPGRAYPYVVAFPDKRGYFQPKFTYAPAYRNREVEIYRVPVSGPPPAGLPPYWYLNEDL